MMTATGHSIERVAIRELDDDPALARLALDASACEHAAS
jgi:hypothetical protein